MSSIEHADEDDDLALEEELAEILQEVPSDFFTEDKFNPFVHWREDPEYLEQLKGDMELAVNKIAERKYKVWLSSIGLDLLSMSTFLLLDKLHSKKSNTCFLC